MNLSHTVKVVGSVVLSAVMAGSMMPVTVFAQNNDENPTEKTETVYSVLNSDGSISDTIVSSWLHDEDGINNIKETLNLTDVKNIKSNEKPSKDGNGVIHAPVSFFTPLMRKVMTCIMKQQPQNNFQCLLRFVMN